MSPGWRCRCSAPAARSGRPPALPAGPGRFRSTVRRSSSASQGSHRPTVSLAICDGQGIRSRTRCAFKDHHPFSTADVRRICGRAAAAGAAAVLTTEKDFVRLLPHRPFPVPVGWVPLTMEPDPPADFRHWLSGCRRGGPRHHARPRAPRVESPNHEPGVLDQQIAARTDSARPRPTLRHRLEYLAVMSVVAAARVLPMRAVLGAGTLLGRAFYLLDRGHRRLAMKNLQAAFPVRSDAECEAIARDMFSHFGRLLTVAAQVQHDASRADARARGIRGRGSRRCRRTRRAGACCSSPATSASGKSTRSCMRSRCSRWRCWRVRSTIRCCTTCSNRSARATGNSVIYRRGAIRRVLRALEANQAVAFLIDQHMQTGRRRLRRLLQPAGGDDVGAGRAGAADRRAGRAGVRAAAARRTLPHGLRARRRAAARRRSRTRSASSPSAAPTCSRCTCAGIRELWLWMHRRWRDVPEGEQVPWNVPGGND